MPNQSDANPQHPLIAVRVPIERAAQAATSALLDLAKSRSQDPSAFDTNPPFFWRVVPSTTKLDSYFTRMTKTTLQNFAADADEGRAFQNSHRHDELPLGYSLTGKFVDGANARVEADCYTMSGLHIGDTNTDDFITMVKGGMVRDVSVGFSGGKWICSICGRDMMSDWDCWHYPGMTYSTNADGGEGRGDKGSNSQLCTADIDGANLSEISAVFDGATPGAGFLKAYRDIELGRIKPEMAMRLEQTYRMKLPPVTSVINVGQPGGTNKPTTVRREDADMALEQDVRQALGIDDSADVVEAIRSLQTVRTKHETAKAAVDRSKLDAASMRAFLGIDDDGVDAFSAARAEIEKLRPMADDGRQYREAMIKDALAEGARAFGDKFREATYRGLLASAKIETIEQMRDDWATAADRFLAGNELDADGNVVARERVGGRLSLEEVTAGKTSANGRGKRVSMKVLS